MSRSEDKAKLFALEAVIRALHHHIKWWNPVSRDNSCSCGADWPCPTILATENVLNQKGLTHEQQ